MTISSCKQILVIAAIVNHEWRSSKSEEEIDVVGTKIEIRESYCSAIHAKQVGVYHEDSFDQRRRKIMVVLQSNALSVIFRWFGWIVEMVMKATDITSVQNVFRSLRKITVELRMAVAFGALTVHILHVL